MSMRLIIGAVVLGMLVGTTNVIAGFTDFIESVKDGVVSGTKTVGRAVGLADYSSGLDGRLIDYLAEKQADEVVEPKADEQIQAGFKQDLIASRKAYVSLAPIAELNKYLNQIKDKLLAVWPGAPVYAHVYLTSRNEFQAVARKNGSITIPLRVLLSLDDEDHLAALIAHELSHIILEHHDSDVLDELTDKILDYSDLILRLSTEKSGLPAKDYARHKAAQMIIQSAFFPQWERGQENEADILGIDLLIGAGYNRNAMRNVIKIIGKTAEEKQKFVANNPIELKRNDTGKQTFGINTETLISNVSGFVDDAFGDDHEAPEQRRKRVREYVKANYKDQGHTDIQSAAYSKVLNKKSVVSYVNRYEKAYLAEEYLKDSTLDDDKRLSKAAKAAYESIKAPASNDAYTRRVLYQVRKDQKKEKSAEKNLQIAYASGEAPYDFYITLAERAYQRNDYKASLGYLNETKKVFGESSELLPKLIAVNTKLGNPIQELQVKCMASGKTKLIELCNTKEWDAG